MLISPCLRVYHGHVAFLLHFRMAGRSVLALFAGPEETGSTKFMVCIFAWL